MSAMKTIPTRSESQILLAPNGWFCAMPRIICLTIVFFFSSQSLWAQDDGFGKAFRGEFPPELSIGNSGWITAGQTEISLEKLRGHVVWLEFSYIECGGCRIMKPILQGLQNFYGPKGLVVVEVNNGEIDKRKSVVEQAKFHKTNYPLLWDEGGKTCNSYGVTTYGAAYLIGADGKVIWNGNPIQLTILEMSMMINAALRKLDLDALKRAKSPFLRSDFSTLPVDQTESAPDTKSNENREKEHGGLPAWPRKLKSKPMKSEKTRFVGVEGRADLLLITSSELKTSWNKFAVWKTRTGRPTKIITVEEISKHFPGKNIQDKIRNCCLAHIQKHKTRAVILGGDSEGEQGGHVPVRGTDHTAFMNDDGVPADIYFLSKGDWDANGDGTYGQFAADLAAVDYFHPNATIGRIPVRTPADVHAYTQKVIAYESNYPTSEFATRMVYTCPVSAAYPKLCESGKQVKSVWHDGTVSNFFANVSPWDRDKRGEFRLEANNWTEMINRGMVSKIHMHGHGTTRAWELEGQSNVNADALGGLNNSNALPVMTTVSCFTGEFDSAIDPSICELMLRQPGGGAIAIIAPSREGVAVFDQDANNPSVDEQGQMDGTTESITYFWEHALSQSTTIGEAFRESKIRMSERAKKNVGIHFIQCELVLFGDPTLDIRSKIPKTIEGRLLFSRSLTTPSIELSNLPDCNICIWNFGNYFEVRQADENGQLSIDIRNLSPGEYSIAAFGPNKNTWVTTVFVE